MCAHPQRREKEWLGFHCSDQRLTRAFYTEKMQIDVTDPRNTLALMALGALPPRSILPGDAHHNVITEFVYDTLGYAPDAEKERLRLRPDFPIGWTYATIENIRVGAAIVRLDYSRAENRIEFLISQPGGPYPVRLVFEPVINVPVRSITIDAQPAELDIATIGKKVVVPVQLMLDNERHVVFDL